ncbi:GFA family protein [Phenylobacterium sp. J367]|uniref:GFA family protein n=1 Tax=Phenylobacterium sp. J367 TaxID=2898435 RepID=UPI00215080A5|nr:GFA family protein [Phenylobacterium sp. J367]MCR5880629.1 GFA family protein [Phenylobacterium sp. J367]
MTLTGACLCGLVRFRTERQPLAARACWCRVCQHLACGSASVNIIVPTEGFEVTGETRGYESVADSGSEMRRTFCPACGTQLFSEALSRPDVMVVRVGALDDPELGAPQSIIWRASAPSWACIDETLPAIDGQPAPVRA